MTTRKNHHATAAQRHDQTVEDSFPASDPPANSGMVGPRGVRRTPSHQRGDDDRPKGLPTDERHATETAHAWEDAEHSARRR